MQAVIFPHAKNLSKLQPETTEIVYHAAAQSGAFAKGDAMSLLSKLSAAILMLGAMLFAGAAYACDYCDSGAYGGREVYSCNNGLYDCRVESSLYRPRCDDGCGRHYGCGDGCYRHREACCEHSYAHGYREGFHDGYATANYEEDDRGFYDGDRHFHNWERWRDGDGKWRDGWHDDKGSWHDRDFHDGHDGHDGWRDSDRRDDHDGHDGHDGDHHDGDHHDGDGHDDHHDGHP